MPSISEGCEEVLDFVRGTRLKIAGLKTFKKGAEVIVVGLEHNGSLNGMTGTVAGFDDARKRWVVDLGDGLGKRLFNETNLRAAMVEALLPPPPPSRPAPRDGGEGGAAAVGPGVGDGEEGAELSEGTRVCITGLGAKHDDLNGRGGALVAFDSERRRWVVELDDGMGRKLLRPANLRLAAGAEACGPPGPALGAGVPAAGGGNRGGPAGVTPAAAALEPRGSTAPGQGLSPGAQVLVEGLSGTGMDHLNGQVGVCEHCEFLSGCWAVFFASGMKAKLRPEYLSRQPATLRPGAYVRLHGLQNARHLNGRLGICGRLDPESLRWEVHLETGESKSLREENLAAQDGYAGPRDEGSSEGNLSATFEEALQSGEISWLDC